MVFPFVKKKNIPLIRIQNVAQLVAQNLALNHRLEILLGMANSVDIIGTDKLLYAQGMLREQRKNNDVIKEELEDSRKISFSRILPALQRLVRQISNELEKQVHLNFLIRRKGLSLGRYFGAGSEIDIIAL